MDGHDLGMIGQALHSRMDGQFAEQAAEGLMLVVGQGLVAEEQHLVVGDGRRQRLSLLGAEGPGQVDPRHLGPDARGQRAQVQQGQDLGVESHVAHSWPNGLSP